VQHSEFNHAADATTHFLQIWIEPARTGVKPGYEQKSFSNAEKRGRLRLVASADGADGSVSMNADASMYAGLFDGDEKATLALRAGRKAYVHLVRGDLQVNGQALHTGDALMADGVDTLTLEKGAGAEVLVFDLAA
jgi:quercetin 2,3-dioxygenase